MNHGLCLDPVSLDWGSRRSRRVFSEALAMLSGILMPSTGGSRKALTLLVRGMWERQRKFHHSRTPGGEGRMVLLLLLSLLSRVQLCNPMDGSPPGFSVHGDYPGKNTGVGCHSTPPGWYYREAKDNNLVDGPNFLDKSISWSIWFFNGRTGVLQELVQSMRSLWI